jgi:signal transduction histidine kinase/ligand-binding sensor domain-containing protein/CheY-like chemotaxis protein
VQLESRMKITSITHMGRILALIAASILSVYVCPASAVSPYTPEVADPFLETWRWQVYPELNGKGLRCLTEDRSGTVWFGVNAGVVSYDGLVWSTHTVDDGLVGAPGNCLLATEDGAVYAGTEMGVSVFRDGVWSAVALSQHTLRWFVNDLVVGPDDAIYAATSWGLLRIGTDEVTLFTSRAKEAAARFLVPDVRVVVVPAAATPGRRWSGSRSGGVGVVVVEDTWPLRRLNFSPRAVRGVFPGGPADKAGLLLGDVITAIDGQFDVRQARLAGEVGSQVRLTVQRQGRDDPFDLEMVCEPLPGTVPELAVHDVHVDSDGAIWLGLVDGEILRYQVKANTWRLFTSEDGLVMGWRPRIDQTRDGSIWTVYNATRAGVNHFDGERWHHHTVPGNTDDNTTLFALSDGSLLVSGIVDLSRFHNGVWTSYRHEQLAMPKTRIAQFLESKDGDIWVAALGGEAYRLDYGDRRWQTYRGLFYQAESATGVKWFLAEDDGVVANEGQTWTRYGVEDGGIFAPNRLIVAQNGDVWVGGAHDGVAATARLRDGRWEKQTHPRLAYGIEKRAVFEDRDGAVWFGAAPAAKYGPTYVGGVIRIKEDTVHHFTPPDVILFVYGIGQTPDGRIWVGSSAGMVNYDGENWSTVTEAAPYTTSFVDEVRTAANGDLWVGNRKYGVLRYDGEEWAHYPLEGDLAQGRVKNILALTNGNVLASTPEGLNGFDGRTWTPHVMPPDLPPISQNGLKQAADGSLWLASYNGGWSERDSPFASPSSEDDYAIKSLHFQPDTGPPDTRITLPVVEVARPGNIALKWAGADQWDVTPEDRLQFAWRIDDEPWSAFVGATNKTLLALPSGDHTFSVKARDLDFNEDPTPAVVQFTVLPPIWQSVWFVALMSLLLLALVAQTWRVLRHRQKLVLANVDLESMNQELQDEIAERSRVEQGLVRLERLRALGEMSAGVSHNLNNILTSIIGPAQLLRRLITDPEQLSQIDTVISSGNRAADLVHRLHLSTRSAKAVELKPVSVAKVVQDSIEAARPRWRDEPQSKGIEIDVVNEVADGPAVKGTESGLHEVLLNLLLNGVDAMPTGGVMTIRSTVDDDNVTLLVSDTGIGMDQETLRRVFEPFFTTKMEVGTGLGMSTAYAEVRRWGGSIEVESTPGSGTTFTMVLPIWEGPVETPDVAVSEEPTRRARVLVVDDDIDVRQLFVDLLGSRHDVEAFINGTAALEGMADDRYDVALVDLGLPGIPGDEVARQLRQADPALALILITGWQLDEEDPRIASFDHRLQKPFDSLTKVVSVLAKGIELCDQRRSG